MHGPVLLSGTRVLLVEDDGEIRNTLAEILRDEGCSVSEAGHGRDALTQLRRAAPPDIVVLDLMMPVMDGWEFRVEQRSDPILAAIPVIAMSADISAKARAIAADAYVHKPIDVDELMYRIRSVIDQAAKRRLATADRMAALGTLASGIAHEINNPLTYVMANLQTLQDRLPWLEEGKAGDLRELFADTMDGVDRIRRIAKQAQMIAPVQPEERESVVPLRNVLETALGLLQRDIGKRASVLVDLGSDVNVRGDRGRLEQLFLNILTNAAHALSETGTRDHEIRVALRTLPSERVLVEISDTGCGIAPEIQERVFQPFFTTKPVGRGTGLGLSICHGIATALGGEIGFESEVGRGTTFRVVLPTTTDAAQRRPSIPAGHEVLRSSPGRRRVLVVDNEASILRVVRQILEPTHDVTTALDADSALAVVLSGHNFDVVLCELVLPGTTGMELFDRLKAARPEIAQRFVFMTGASFTPSTRRFFDVNRRPWLAKPFDGRQLLAAVGAAVPSEADAAAARQTH